MKSFNTYYVEELSNIAYGVMWDIW